jgi:hypothetical protein
MPYQPAPEPAVIKHQTDLKVVPDPTKSAAAPKRNTSTSGEIHLKARVPDADAQDPEDTIFIDKEGTLHDRDDDEEKAKPKS